MAEFFYFLILSITIWWSFTSFRNKKQDVQRLSNRKPVQTTKVPDKPMMVVKRSVNDIVGTYKDTIIYLYVELDDGRQFIYESIAVEKTPGVYHADSTDNYIIVDKYLLYREVKIS